jgi:uncharacterized protein YceK
MRRQAVGLTAVLAFALGGCGTFHNLLPPDPKAEKKAEKEAPRPEAKSVYGGVGLDASVGASWLAAAFVPASQPHVTALETAVDSTCKVGIGAYVLAVDLPLSAVADTLTLPITVPATLKKPARPDKPAGRGPQKEADEGYDVDAPDDPPPPR